MKEFSEQYLKRNKDDNDELICFWGLLFLLLTFCMIPIGILDTNNQFIEHYKESIVGLWIIIFTFSMMLPNKILVKFLPKTTYINLIFKNNYNGDISDILDIKDEITKKIISENKERIKFYVHSNGYLSGKTLAYLLKEINRENLRIKKEERFSNKSLNFVEKNNIKKERIEKIDKE